MGWVEHPSPPIPNQRLKQRVCLSLVILESAKELRPGFPKQDNGMLGSRYVDGFLVFMLLWFYGFMVLWFYILWFYSFMVVWFHGFMVYGFVVFWFCGFMVFGFGVL